jgi:hypothetical protein
VSPAPPLPPPSAAEQKAIDDAIVRLADRAPRFALRMRQNDDNQVDVLGADHNDHQGWLTRLEDAFGTRGQAFPVSSLNRLMASCREKDGKIDSVKLNGMLAMIEGAKPRNEIEAALAMQMAQTHAAAQLLLVRAMTSDQIPMFDAANNGANKLLRTFALQAETLAKLQRGGEQIVKVVHVHAGAQAVIGNVTTGANGGTGEGATHENRNQPHAKGLLPANGPKPMPEMRGHDAARAPVPITRRRR